MPRSAEELAALRAEALALRAQGLSYLKIAAQLGIPGISAWDLVNAERRREWQRAKTARLRAEREREGGDGR
jgi:hypothetical protein